MRAHNFTVADLPNLMEFLHRRGVKGYVTFNTLVFENELADATEYLRAIIAAGVDAANRPAVPYEPPPPPKGKHHEPPPLPPMLGSK